MECDEVVIFTKNNKKQLGRIAAWLEDQSKCRHYMVVPVNWKPENNSSDIDEFINFSFSEKELQNIFDKNGNIISLEAGNIINVKFI